MTARTKAFDCVEMKQRGAERVRAMIEGMSREEELVFWARGTAEMQKNQQNLRKALHNKKPPK